MARVATGVKHKVGALWEAAIGGAPDIGVMLLISAGLEAEDVLADRDTIADILAATNDEATFTGYTRKTVSPAIVRDNAADTQTLTLDGSPPLTIEWTAAGGAGGLGTNNILGRLVYFYDPAPGSSTDAQKIHLASTPANMTTDGSTLRVTVPASGIATYRDGTAARPVSAAALAPPDGSVTNAKVAVGAAITLDKTADSASRLAMTAAERAKLDGIAAGADNSVEVDVQIFTESGTWNRPAGVSTVYVEAIGGGGGGGAGARRASGTLSTGGSGGSGAGTTKVMLPASVLGASETVTVGAGGAGAAVTSTNDTNGAAGTNGGASTLGSRVRAGGGGGGGGGTSTGTSTVGSTGTGTHNGGTGATSNATGGTGSNGNSGGAAGGGSGGGIATTPANTAGGAGGTPSTTASGAAGAAGTSGGGAGGAGTSTAPTGSPIGGAGGGGGGSSTTAAGGGGGNGSLYGAGGGGGGAALNGQNSGAGGVGQPGIVVVTSW